MLFVKSIVHALPLELVLAPPALEVLGDAELEVEHAEHALVLCVTFLGG